MKGQREYRDWEAVIIFVAALAALAAMAIWGK